MTKNKQNFDLIIEYKITLKMYLAYFEFLSLLEQLSAIRKQMAQTLMGQFSVAPAIEKETHLKL